MYKFELFRDSRNQYRFRLVAANGEIVATSEAYTRKASLIKTWNSANEAIINNQVVILDLTKQKV